MSEAIADDGSTATDSTPPTPAEGATPASTPTPTPNSEPSPSGTDASDSSTTSPAAPATMEKPVAVVLDFHGTTTPVTLVKDTLMPYIKNNVDKYLKDNWGNKRLKKDINRIRKELAGGKKDVDFKIKEKDASPTEIQRSVSDYVKWYVDKDMAQEHGANKEHKEQEAVLKLMKHMWHEAYETGTIQTPIFDDVEPAMRKWKEDGIKVYIFSSNKVEAQKQFFKQTDRGNLLELIDGHFDKTCGLKTSTASYSKISQTLSIPADKLVYISDSPKEAKAAMKAGMKVVLVHRKGNREVKDKERKGIPLVQSFSEITFN